MNISTISNLLKLAIFLLGITAIVKGIAKFVRVRRNGESIWHQLSTIVVSIALAALCFCGGAAMGDAQDQFGDYVKGNYPSSISDITYGQAIESVCENLEWSNVTREYNTGGGNIVQMDADCVYQEEERKITIQFRYGQEFSLIDENTPFEISFVGFDDSAETSVSDMQEIIYSMFEVYASEHQMTIDESAKDGILYSAGEA